MAFGFGLCMAFLLSMWATGTCDLIPQGALRMECRDRYFMIAVDLSFAGEKAQFEAVDATGVHPITAEYAAKCGYTLRVAPLQGLVELRASYFSCHTDNQGDEIFTFWFNLITTDEGEKGNYTLNKTCRLALPWAPREVTCESNYMEVSIITDVTCPTKTTREDWDSAIQTAYSSADSEWQLMFKRDGVLTPKNFSEAEKEGYVFELTEGRLVFRTPYGQPDSFKTEVSGVPVEAVHPLLFARQRWVVLVVEVVAACSAYQASYNESGHILWEIPSSWSPLVTCLDKTRTTVGVNGALEEPLAAEEKGYVVTEEGNAVRISIPYNAEGGHRKSLALGELLESYVFELYMEQVSTDDDNVTTRLCVHKTLDSPILRRPLLLENRTDPEEHSFTVFLGNIPADVNLTAVRLNGVEFVVPFANASGATLAEELQADATRGYILKVPLGADVVTQQLFKEEAVMRYNLDVNYTLTVLPEETQFHHLASVELLMDVSPPTFTTACSESGVSFTMSSQPFSHLWTLRIGPDLLTSELAAQHGYNLSSEGQSLQLYVPFFSHGFKYKDVTLQGFTGEFEILVLDAETSAVQNSAVETCPFTASEFILCSNDGVMTLVADLSALVPGGGASLGAPTLWDSSCTADSWDGTRALFSTRLGTCGGKVQFGKESVTYENKISLSQSLDSEDNRAESGEAENVTVQCTYPLSGLHSLFLGCSFESENSGVGKIIHSTSHSSSPKDESVTTARPATVPPRKPPVRFSQNQSKQSPKQIWKFIPQQRRTGYHQLKDW